MQETTTKEDHQEWLVHVFTSDVKGAGTDSKVYMTFMDNTGKETSKFWLNNLRANKSSNKDPFERAQMDDFLVRIKFFNSIFVN